ncbi:MAG TPA: hypothetical protein VD931_13865 [Baekduia sp.]|nr:hypothetical protein [Baekduia sp.]
MLLHGADDRARVTEAARSTFATEVWGGQGTDVLRSDAGYDTSPEGPEGIDTLDLSTVPYGVRADLNVCRLGFHGTQAAGLVQAMERVIGTSYNDRLGGDAGANVLVGGRGVDWLTGEDGPDRIDSNDGGADTVRCSAGADTYVGDAADRREGC